MHLNNIQSEYQEPQYEANSSSTSNDTFLNTAKNNETELAEKTEISNEAENNTNEALIGVMPEIQQALTTKDDQPASLAENISPEELPEQIFKLDFAAKLFQALSNAKDISDKDRIHYLSMVHKIFALIITLATIIAMSSNQEKQLKQDGPSLKILKHLYKRKFTKEADIEEADFNFEKAFCELINSKDEQSRYAITDLSVFFSDLITEGCGAEILNCGKQIPPKFHEKIILQCLKQAAKNRTAEYTEHGLLGQVCQQIDSENMYHSDEIIKKLQQSNFEIGICCIIRTILKSKSTSNIQKIIKLIEISKKSRKKPTRFSDRRNIKNK